MVIPGSPPPTRVPNPSNILAHINKSVLFSLSSLNSGPSAFHWDLFELFFAIPSQNTRKHTHTYNISYKYYGHTLQRNICHCVNVVKIMQKKKIKKCESVLLLFTTQQKKKKLSSRIHINKKNTTT